MKVYKLFYLFALSLVMSLLAACGSEPVRKTPSTAVSLQNTIGSYRLSEGDKVNIVVFGEDELTLDVVLNKAGTFTYPYLGQLNILGKTVADVEQMITDGLSLGYLVDPKVSVTMDSFREIYVGGEVEQGGNFPFQPGLTVSKAIVLAGGFTERAARSRIYVVSEGAASTKPVRVTLDYVLQPGDVVTIRRRFF